MAEDDPKQPSDLMVHPPLPYLVQVRCSLSEDAIPETRTFRLMAYSAMEAALQASMEAGGVGLEGEKVKIEKISPDLDAYAQLFGVPSMAKIIQSLAKLK